MFTPRVETRPTHAALFAHFGPDLLNKQYLRSLDFILKKRVWREIVFWTAIVKNCFAVMPWSQFHPFISFLLMPSVMKSSSEPFICPRKVRMFNFYKMLRKILWFFFVLVCPKLEKNSEKNELSFGVVNKNLPKFIN